MEKVNQKIADNNDIQTARKFIKGERIINKTETKHDEKLYIEIRKQRKLEIKHKKLQS